MSEYEYNLGGRRITVEPALVRNDCIYITAQKSDVPLYGAWIANEDAPTIAAELLKAAGQESVIVAKAYEEVERRGDELTCGGGPEWAGASIAANPNWLRNKAANCIAIAEYIENKASREAEAEKKLQERRDALAAELSEGRRTYGSTGLTAQAAIDRIIELEDGK